MVHTLTDSEIENTEASECRDIKYEPETPRRESLIESKLRPNKQNMN